MKTTIAFFAILFFSSAALKAETPVAGIKVTLYKKLGKSLTKVSSGVTDKAGNYDLKLESGKHSYYIEYEIIEKGQKVGQKIGLDFAGPVMNKSKHEQAEDVETTKSFDTETKFGTVEVSVIVVNDHITKGQLRGTINRSRSNIKRV